MAPKLFLSLSFLLLITIHVCIASQFQQPLFQQKNECMIQRLNALEPVERVQSEAGYTEFFDSNEQQFRCAGAEVIRHTIQPQGLLLPSYTNTPILFYVEKGKGIQGVMLPGCPETFEVTSQQQSQGGSQVEDRHQKIHHFIKGDMVAIPIGAAHWLYNDGQDELVIVALLDSTNAANQLGKEHLRFFLAGNSQGTPSSWGRSQQKGYNNIFQGLGVEIVAEAFNVDRETAEMLRCDEDERGHIVLVQRGLQVVSPTSRVGRQQEQRPGQGPSNGIEGTICSMKLRENIDEPSQADLYNPQAGRSTTLNSLKLPILKFLDLSAQRTVLYKNAMVAPLWLNAHRIIYVTDGRMRVQIVNDQGQEVFNNHLEERQLVVVPQNFAVVKQADQQGCKYITFKTSDKATINTLAGKNSVMRALPVDVISSAYQISLEEAQKVKYGRQETILLSNY